MIRTNCLKAILVAAAVTGAGVNHTSGALVGLWRFDEGLTSTGTAWLAAYDASGHGLSGNLFAVSGSTIPQRIDGSPGSPGATGSAAGALRFGIGSNQNKVSILYQNVFNDILNSPAATGEITFSAWVSSEQVAETAGVTVFGRIFERQYWYYYLDDLPSIDSFGGNFTSPLQGMANLTQTALPVSADSSTAPQWTHTALTFDGTTARFYVNATQVHSIDLPGRVIASQSASGMTIGNEAGTASLTRQVVGALDDVALFNKALSQAEIAQIMSGNFTGYLSPFANAVSALQPSHYYRFFETGGVLASDGGFAAAKRPAAMQFGTPSTFNATGPAPDDGLMGFQEGNSAYNPQGADAFARALDLGAGSNFAAEQMTVAMWINASEGKPYTWDRLFTNNQTTANNNFTIAMTEAAGYEDIWGLWLSTGTGNADAKILPKATLDLADGNWHYIFAVRESDNRNFSLSIDGVDYTGSLVNPSVQNLSTSGSNAWIGGRASTDVVFDGMIDDPAIWVGQALTVHQGRAMYYAAKPDPYAVAVNELRPSHYYRFEEDGGVNASDGGFDAPNRRATMPFGTPSTLNAVGPRPDGGFRGLWETNSAYNPKGAESGTPRALDLGSGSDFAAEQMTVAMWIKAPEGPAYSWDRLFTNNQSEGNDNFTMALTKASGHAGLWLSTGTDQATARMLPGSLGDLDLFDGEWHFLFAVRDGNVRNDPNALRLMIDGVDYTDDLTNTGNWLGVEGTNAWIGGRTSTSQVFDGLMDEVAIWVGDALTMQQGRALYVAAVPEPSTLLLAALGLIGPLAACRRRANRPV